MSSNETPYFESTVESERAHFKIVNNYATAVLNHSIIEALVELATVAIEGEVCIDTK